MTSRRFLYISVSYRQKIAVFKIRDKMDLQKKTNEN